MFQNNQERVLPSACCLQMLRVLLGHKAASVDTVRWVQEALPHWLPGPSTGCSTKENEELRLVCTMLMHACNCTVIVDDSILHGTELGTLV